jgi:predicted NBD/HSP70 family sugar kinase
MISALSLTGTDHPEYPGVDLADCRGHWSRLIEGENMSDELHTPTTIIGWIKLVTAVLGLGAAIAIPLSWCFALSGKVDKLEARLAPLEKLNAGRPAALEHEANCSALARMAANAHTSYDTSGGNRIEELMEREDCIKPKSDS